MGRKVTDIITIFLSFLPLYLFSQINHYDIYFYYGIIGGSIIIILTNLLTLILDLIGVEKEDITYWLDISAMGASYLMITSFMFGSFLATNELYVFNFKIMDLSSIPFGYYFLFSFSLLFVLTSTMAQIEDSVAIVLTLPVLALTLAAKLGVTIWDLLFPPRVRELVPYLDVTRTLILSGTQIFADPDRLQTEKALESLDNMSEQVEEIAEGYALRKGIGQGIDMGLTVVVFAFFGVLTILTDDLGIPPAVVALLFSTLALALSTFAGFFGPFYGLAGAAKDFTLRNGNYRAASIYKAFEEIFAIPFMAASTGFLFLDLPPIDSDTLQDFKNEMNEQLTEISDNINSLIGKDKSAIPRKTRKMIGSLMASTEASMSKLDFRNIREETARQFALSYFQHEFSLKPWSRKEAVEEFAKKNHFDLQTAEETLQLIGFKIQQGQMGDDMVNNVMISAALRGVIKMEQKYQEILEDVELGQTCTGLAFGARQFLKDHYQVRTTQEKVMSMVKNGLIGLFAIPAVIVISFHNYANRFFDKLADTIMETIFFGKLLDDTKLRYREIIIGIKSIPNMINQRLSMIRGRTEAEKEKKKKQRNWQIRRAIKRVFSLIWEVLVFPFMVIINSSKWLYSKLFNKEIDPRQSFEEAVAHAALVSMYEELYERLVKQTHVSTAY